MQIRPMRDEDRLPLALLYAAVAIALYRELGFVEEGRRVKQYRRANGELWDARCDCCSSR